ncbi:uncharacterized protein C6orf132 homolog [Pteronotus mesoamericanus]|uniref:uncharacterized protein C6orf132 homolog n=1 Tax=Pteronotus mesoamericanus TaxID=1884717 RepID=UPI0023EB61DF|nr:uncharacterized protein C6orf132 homolog [Pteronotus parnellii mesoamericanus]
MKKSQTVQGTFSKIFGKKHANPNTTSLYATNPPWIFTQEAPEEGTRDFDGIYYGDNRFDVVSESGTATLKARPRVRPLLTFLPLNAQENHGLAVPTPSVPEDFADKEVTGASSLVNGNLRLYSSVGDLRPGHYGQDLLIPPPPPGPAPGPPPGPPPDTSQPRGASPPSPPPSRASLPPALRLEPPPPPSMAPPPPPVLGALSPPSTPTPPDFIPPAPPLAFLAPPPPPMPAPAPPAPVSPHMKSTHLFPPAGVTKWKSDVALNGKQPEAPRTSPPRSPAEPKGSPLGPKSEPHLTFPRSFKVPPPTPVRTSSIPAQEAQGSPPEEEGTTKKAPGRLPLPPNFHIRPASQVYPDRAPEPDGPGERSTAAPASPRLSQSQTPTNEQAETLSPASPLPIPTAPPPPPAPPLPPPAPPLPPPAPPLPSASLLPPPTTSLPPAAPPLPSDEKMAPPPARFMKSPKSSSPAPKPKPNPPSPEDTASSEPVDWRDPTQMAKLRSELAAYLFGSRREDQHNSHRPGPMAASQGKEGKKSPSLPKKEAPPSLPEKGAPPSDPEKSRSPEREATASLPLPPVDYIPQDSPTPRVQQIRNELEARLSLAEKESKPGKGSLPPKPRLEGGRIFENRADNGQFSKPVAKNIPPFSTTPLPTTPHQSKATSGPATPPNSTPATVTSGPAMPPKATPGPAASGPATPGPATPPKAGPGPAVPSAATTLPTTSFQQTAEKNLAPAEQWKKPEPQEFAVPSQPEAEGRPSEASKLPTQGALSSPALPPKIAPGREATSFYRPHVENSASQEVAVVMPTMARGEAARSGEPVDAKEPQGLPAKPLASAQLADELLRHPVTGEVVERGSPMALLLAARQRAQKGRSRGAGLSRSSLPGSLRGHSDPPQASSDSIFLKDGRPNSFTVVPRVPTEAEKDPQLASSVQPTIPHSWKAQWDRDPEGTEPSRGHKWTKAEPPARAAWERPASSSVPQGHLLPKSFSSPSSPSFKGQEEKFSFEVIPPPPEFSNDPEPPAPALQYLGRGGSPPGNKFSNLGKPLDVGPAASARFLGGERYSGAGGLERFSRGSRSLIKKRLYVGEPHRSPGLSRGGSGRSLSSPNCCGTQPGAPGGPEVRRVNSAGRARPGGLGARRMSLEGSARVEAKFKAPGKGPIGDRVLPSATATGRSPRSTPHYRSPINTFTVRPGTRHPISYAYSGAHRNAPS